MMFSKRRNALAARAVVASIALSGARALSAEEESRLLVAVTAPKVVDVGGDSLGDGYATISFKTGPNLVSYDYTVSCYERDLLVPTTSCNAIAADEIPVAGVSASGETGTAYDKLYATVTGLEGDVTYDCFIYTYGPQGYEKCKYVGSTDIGCFSAEPLVVNEENSFPSVDFTVIPPVPGLYLQYDVAGLGNPPIAANTPNVVKFDCLPGDNAVCSPGDYTLSLSYPNYPSVPYSGVGFDTLNLNSPYTCFSVIEDTCDPTAEPICSDPYVMVSPPVLAEFDPLPSLTMFTSLDDGSVTANCLFPTIDGDYLDVFTAWTCDGAGAWFDIDCPVGSPGGTSNRAITGFAPGETIACYFWQGQGKADSGCSPTATQLCNWSAGGPDVDPTSYPLIWANLVTYTTPSS